MKFINYIVFFVIETLTNTKINKYQRSKFSPRALIVLLLCTVSLYANYLLVKNILELRRRIAVSHELRETLKDNNSQLKEINQSLRDINRDLVTEAKDIAKSKCKDVEKSLSHLGTIELSISKTEDQISRDKTLIEQDIQTEDKK